MSARERPWAGRRLHFVGIGGAGMSGYARAAHALGASVSGSDRAPSPYLARLREEGVLDAQIGHHERNVPDGVDVELIYSSAIGPENPERAAARARGLPERPRAQLLGELTALRRTIAVAGAHGKTTTCAMLVHILREQGADPGWLVGSTVGLGLENSHWSEGEWLVVEADESDRSMLSLRVEIAVLTNVELDHHATFSSLGELRDAFREFLAHATHANVVWDRPELLALVRPRAASQREGFAGGTGTASSVPPASPGAHGSFELVTGGPASSAPAASPGAGAPLELVAYDVSEPVLEDGCSRFRWRALEVGLVVPGAHNARNATAALEAARLVGIDGRGAALALAGFTGAGRRFQRVGTSAGGAQVYDDYAHHPTEVAATLDAARTLAPRRLVAVFQPHLYSRTAIFAREFGAALARADAIAVLDVYPARERAEDHPGVSGLSIARAAAESANGREVLWLPGFDAAERVLAGILREGDVCVAMGAGDVDALARRLVA